MINKFNKIALALLIGGAGVYAAESADSDQGLRPTGVTVTQRENIEDITAHMDKRNANTVTRALEALPDAERDLFMSIILDHPLLNDGNVIFNAEVIVGIAGAITEAKVTAARLPATLDRVREYGLWERVGTGYHKVNTAIALAAIPDADIASALQLIQQYHVWNNVTLGSAKSLIIMAIAGIPDVERSAVLDIIQEYGLFYGITNGMYKELIITALAEIPHSEREAVLALITEHTLLKEIRHDGYATFETIKALAAVPNGERAERVTRAVDYIKDASKVALISADLYVTRLRKVLGLPES